MHTLMLNMANVVLSKLHLPYKKSSTILPCVFYDGLVGVGKTSLTTEIAQLENTLLTFTQESFLKTTRTRATPRSCRTIVPQR